MALEALSSFRIASTVASMTFSSFRVASTVASMARSWASLASTIASMSEAGSTEAKSEVEHAIIRIPMNTVRTLLRFICLFLGLPDSDVI